jgi:hypothetical protein
MKNILTTLSAVTALALGAAGAFADNSTRPTDSTTATKAAKRMTVEELGAMLKDAGYTLEPSKDKDGKIAGYTVKLKSGTWTIYVDVSLGSDGTTVWLTASLQKIDGNMTIPTSVLLNLLKSNSAIFPAEFACYDNGMIYLRLPMPNVDVTVNQLREQITYLADILKETAPLWDATRWPKVGTSATTQAAPPAPAPAPKG